MLVRFRASEHLERHPVIRINAHLVAGFQRGARKIGRALQDDRLRSVFRTDAQTVFADHFCDFRHWSGCFETEIADNDERVVDQNARSLFQLRQRNARIDIAIIIRAAHDDMCGVFGNCTEKCTDPIRRRGHFLDHFLELLDHLPRFADHLRLIGNVRPEIEKIAADRIARRK